MNTTTTDKSGEPYVLAKDADLDPVVVGLPGRTGIKQGHKCCGGCCDMRRAVIIVNIISMCFIFLGIISFLALMRVMNQPYDDDEVSEAMGEINDGLSGTWLIVVSVIKLIAHGVGIYGALQYNYYMVGVSAVVYIIDFFVAIVMIDIGSMVYCGFFAYPHIFFINEVKKGIMSKENYHNEEQSCCCV